MTLEECKAAWAAVGHPGTKAERIARNAKWLSFYGYLAGKENVDAPEAHWRIREVVETLKREGVISAETTLLDIGAGTGAFSLPLCNTCAEVTALEMERASVALLKQRAEKRGIDNLHTVNAMWENFEPEQKYDVTFSSMCPAICDYEELLRMEGMTKSTCCILAVAKGSVDLHRQKLMREIFKITPSGGMNSEASWYYDMLYLMGRQPNVKTFSRISKSRLPVEYLVERNKIYFQIFDISPEQSEPILREYYSRVGVDGMVEDETCINNALIWWKVPEKV